jgi:hypothetical protein
VQLGNFLRILLDLMVDNLALKLVVEVRNLLMVFLVRRMNLLLFENSNDFKKLSFLSLNILNYLLRFLVFLELDKARLVLLHLAQLLLQSHC